MDGIESNKSSLPVNDNENNNTEKSGKRVNVPAKKAKRTRKEQPKDSEKQFEKITSDNPEGTTDQKSSDQGNKSETED